MTIALAFAVVCVIGCPGKAQVCKPAPPQASSLALALAQMPDAAKREKSLGSLEGHSGARTIFTAVEVGDPKDHNVVVRGLRIRLEQGSRRVTVYLDDENHGLDADPQDYFADVARMIAREIEERIQPPKGAEVVAGGDLALSNRRSGVVLNLGWWRDEEDGICRFRFHTEDCGNFEFPEDALPKIVGIFTAASRFLNGNPLQNTK